MWIFQEVFTYIIMVLSGLVILAFFVRILFSIFKKS